MFLPFNDADDRINVSMIRKIVHTTTKGDDGSDIPTLIVMYREGGGGGEAPEPHDADVLFGEEAARFEVGLHYLYDHGFGPEVYGIMEAQALARQKQDEEFRLQLVNQPKKIIEENSKPGTDQKPAEKSENVADQAVKKDIKKKPPASDQSRLN